MPVLGQCGGICTHSLTHSLTYLLTHLLTTQMGPVSAQELASLLQGGVLCDTSYVYEDGADDWVAMSSVRAMLSISRSEPGDVQVD